MQVVLQTPTPNLAESLSFYRKLQFHEMKLRDRVFFSDGHILIEVNPDRYARSGFQLYSSQWSEKRDQLEGLTHIVDTANGSLVSDPSGVWVYLQNEGTEVPPSMEGTSPSVLGKFAGMSLETTDLNRSADFWSLFGFVPVYGSEAHGFIALKSVDDFHINLMKPLSCPHSFYNPSLTYFNGKQNVEVIQAIREAGVPITEEVTVFNKEGQVDNVILRDPGGLGFFIFND